MTEAKFQTAFSKWAKYNIRKTTAFELKISKTYRMPLDHILPHQWLSLKNAKSGTLVYKIPDEGFAQKPFDCFVLSGSEAYIVILFYLKRGDKTFFMIDIDDLIRFKAQEHKSITWDEARMLAHKIGTLA